MAVFKVKLSPWISEGSPLFGLSQSCAFILAANWAMQGMRRMDGGELIFRFAVFLTLSLLLEQMGMSAIGALLLAHTINFACNGHPWVCCHSCVFYRHSPQRDEAWLENWVLWLQLCPFLDEAVIIGSSAERLTTRRSDINLRLITRPGMLGWFLTNLLLLIIRSHALLRLIPLDAYVYDHPRSLKRVGQDKPMTILVDRGNRLSILYSHRLLTTL